MQSPHRPTGRVLFSATDGPLTRTRTPGLPLLAGLGRRFSRHSVNGNDVASEVPAYAEGSQPVTAAADRLVAPIVRRGWPADVPDSERRDSRMTVEGARVDPLLQSGKQPKPTLPSDPGIAYRHVVSLL